MPDLGKGGVGKGTPPPVVPCRRNCKNSCSFFWKVAGVFPFSPAAFPCRRKPFSESASSRNPLLFLCSVVVASIYKRCISRYRRFFVFSWKKVAAIVAWDAERPYFCTRFREVNTSRKQPHNESLPGWLLNKFKKFPGNLEETARRKYICRPACLQTRPLPRPVQQGPVWGDSHNEIIYMRKEAARPLLLN